MQEVYIKSRTEPTLILTVNDDGEAEPLFMYLPETGEMIPYLDVAVGLTERSAEMEEKEETKGVKIGATSIPVFTYNEKGERFKVLDFNPQTKEYSFAEGIGLCISSDNRMVIDKMTKKGE